MRIKITFFFLFFSLILHAQDENSLKGKTGPTIIPVITTGNNPIIILDGLILSKIEYLKLNIDESYSKKFKIKVLSEREAIKKYEIINIDGIVEIKTDLLYVLNNEYLTTSKSKKKLSKLTQTNILDITMLKKEDAVKEYDKLGRHGALIIRTKK